MESITNTTSDERIAVHCDACGRDWRVPANLAGHHGKCACGHVLIVPHAEAPPGTIQCPHCGKWTRPEGWCEWCSASLDAADPVHLPSLHVAENVAAQRGADAQSMSMAVNCAWFLAAVLGLLLAICFSRHILNENLSYSICIISSVVAFSELFVLKVEFRFHNLVMGALAATNLALGLFFWLNVACDRSPSTIVVAAVIGSGQEKSTGRHPQLYSYVDVEGWRPEQPAVVRLVIPWGLPGGASSGTVEVLTRRGALGVAWREDVSGHEATPQGPHQSGGPAEN
jgi:hypothetical protein